MHKTKKIMIFIIVILMLINSPVLGLTSEENKKVYIFILNRWALEDIKEMDWLNSNIERMSLGLMNTRGYNSYSGSESFLTINSGSKAVSNDDSSEFILLEENKIKNKEIGKLYNLNSKNRYRPEIGYLGDKLKENNKTIKLVGNSNTTEENFNYSALMAMDSKGIVNNYFQEDLIVNNSKYPYDIKTNYEQLLNYTFDNEADLTIVDLGDLERLYRCASNYDGDKYIQVRNNILEDIDLYLKNIISEILKKEEDSLIFLMSPNAPDFNISDSKLAPLVIINNNIGKDGFTSSTTKRENIISNLDIAPTILKHFNIPSEGNHIIFKEDISSNYEDILTKNNRINLTSKVRYKSLLYYASMSIILISIIILLFVNKIILPKRIELILISLISLIYITPIIFIFLPLFKLTNNITYWLITIFIVSIVFLLEYKNQLVSNNIFNITIITLGYLFIDMILNGSLTQYSVLSYDPSIGARYYGIGNEMVGVLIGLLGIITCINLKKGRSRFINYILFLIAIILAGMPKFGANLGGTLALITIILFYFLENKNIEISISKLFFIGVFIMSSFLIIGILDMKLNPNMTHLGRTITKISQEGLGSFINIAFRKLLMNIKLTGNSFWIYVLLLNLIYLSISQNKLEDELKGEFKLIISIIMGIIVGFLLNDSGLITAAISLNILTSQLILRQRYKIIENIKFGY